MRTAGNGKYIIFHFVKWKKSVRFAEKYFHKERKSEKTSTGIYHTCTYDYGARQYDHVLGAISSKHYFTTDERNVLHDRISHQGLGYHDIEELIYDLFGK